MPLIYFYVNDKTYSDFKTGLTETQQSEVKKKVKKCFEKELNKTKESGTND